MCQWDPAERRELDVLDGLPRPTLAGWAAGEFGFVVAIDRLCQRIVVGICDGADRGSCSDLGEALAVANRGELRPCIAVTSQSGQLGAA